MGTAGDGPIAMFNALWFKPDGLQSYARYAEQVMPILTDLGATLVTPFLPLDDALEGGFDPFVTGFVRYPSAAAFDEMWQSRRYREVAHLRTDAVERAVLTRCRLEPADSANATLLPGVVVLNMLWFHDSGRERYDEYLQAAAPLVDKVGGRYVTPRFVPDKAYEDDVVPDLVFLGNYPSRQAMFDLVGDADYAAAAEIRTSAVARSVTTTLLVH